ncbi:SAM-dependent methyltransferase [hydrothermal vent metagenome]|uniref:Calmodulin-lysine N-methyltransferase n=1 Tax=hydrothermal vent metagenome TaxID=652676 RepID=A0A3B0VW47_9ZZZZ
MTTPLRLRYQTIEFGSTDIHLCTLRDNRQFDDPEGVAEELGISSASWPLFGVIWPAGLVLAHYISSYPTAGKRILEMGCGMALSSLLLNGQKANITATDHHPEAEFFLQRNTLLNHGKDIDYQRVDWADKTDELGLFDLIIGSDILYEDQHVKMVADFINDHASPQCEIILTDPGRGNKNKLGKLMQQYGYSYTVIKPEHTDYLDKPFKGHILKFWRDG